MISGRELGSVIATRVGAPDRPSGQVSARPASASTGQDGVTLSPESATVGQWLSALHGLPDVRPDRVQAAKTRLDVGVAPASTDVARQMLSRIVGDRLAAGG